MKTIISCTVAACILLTGCSHAPFNAPNVAKLYAIPPYLEKSLNEPLPAPNDLIGMQALGVAKEHAIGALDDAQEVDRSTGFKIENDLVAIGVLAGAGVGALVNAHSDLYKSLGALLGLSIGLDVYLSPKEQSAIYLKAAKAFSCSADEMYQISRLTTNVTPDDVERLNGALPAYEHEAKSQLYSTDLQARLTGKSPFFISKVIQVGINAEINIAAIKEALGFLSRLQMIGNSRKKEIILFTVEEITKVSYDRDKALKKISGYSIPPKDLEAMLRVLNPAFSSLNTSDGFEQLNQNLQAIVDAINNYRSCVDPLYAKATTE